VKAKTHADELTITLVESALTKPESEREILREVAHDTMGTMWQAFEQTQIGSSR
jgi:hypothetical protein